jgi:hypothetical protein
MTDYQPQTQNHNHVWPICHMDPICVKLVKHDPSVCSGFLIKLWLNALVATRTVVQKLAGYCEGSIHLSLSLNGSFKNSIIQL